MICNFFLKLQFVLSIQQQEREKVNVRIPLSFEKKKKTLLLFIMDDPTRVKFDLQY